LQREDNFVRVA